MSSVVVLDDALLFRWLARRLDLAESDVPATTASWWFRLARAVIQGGGGRLARGLLDQPGEVQERIRARVLKPPMELVVPDVRAAVPAAALLSVTHGLNLLAAEALAAAQLLNGRILVATHADGPLLRTAAVAAGIQYDAIDV